MGVDRALVRLEGDAVHRIEQLGAREDAARLAGHRREELELGCRQLDDAAGHLEPHPRHVQRQLADAQHVVRTGSIPATKHGAHARDQLRAG